MDLRFFIDLNRYKNSSTVAHSVGVCLCSVRSKYIRTCVSQIYRRERGQGKHIFPAVELTTSRIGNQSRLIHTLLKVLTICIACMVIMSSRPIPLLVVNRTEKMSSAYRCPSLQTVSRHWARSLQGSSSNGFCLFTNNSTLLPVLFKEKSERA